jgi:cytochrome c553
MFKRVDEASAMTRHISRLLSVTFCSMLLAAPGLAQPVNARSSAGVDLDARLKQVVSDSRLSEASYKAGSKVAGFCANCHGDGGNSVKPDVPNLAGQNTSYLLEQLRQFSDGRRQNEFMERLIRALSADEKVGLVVFYAKQEVTHKPAPNASLAGKGKDYYSEHCSACHGERGRGSEAIARIAGQQADYVARTLKHYRDGSKIRQQPLMAAATRLMTDADIAAVVAYVSSMN